MDHEQQWLAKVRQQRIPASSGVVLGIGDDCAIFRAANTHNELLFTTDLLVQDVHFRRGTHAPEAIGYKALARGLSDIAAMGGVPQFCLLSLAISPDTNQAWVDRFFTGLLHLARRYAVPLAGGDLGHAPRVTCDIVVCGSALPGQALRRSGAQPGNQIVVSGYLGGSAVGLAAGGPRAVRRHLYPQPRLALGQALRSQFQATAAMDLSDGISLDLHRLCLASEVSARLDTVPVFPGASLEQALHGGEDYELLFTVPADCPVPPLWQGTPLTAVGRIENGAAGTVLWQDEPLPALGYDHTRTHAPPHV